MDAKEALERPEIGRIVGELSRALGEGLRSVVLYGSAARGDFHRETSDYNLIVVTRDLEPGTLEAMSPALRGWLKRGHPAPRLFTPALILESADVFPIEMLDLQRSRVVLHGEDPFAGVEVSRDNLRLQCERELKTKMMRLREGYVECHDRPKELRRLLTDSYSTFTALFRGCLQLVASEVPQRNSEVISAFCARAGLDAEAFTAVHRLKHGAEADGELKAVFARYYQELTRAVDKVDRFGISQGGPRS
jgi:predicted nucleotidyltransferase